MKCGMVQHNISHTSIRLNILELNVRLIMAKLKFYRSFNTVYEYQSEECKQLACLCSVVAIHMSAILMYSILYEIRYLRVK